MNLWMFSPQVHRGALFGHVIISWSHIWRRLSETSISTRWLDTFLTQSWEAVSGGYLNWLPQIWLFWVCAEMGLLSMCLFIWDFHGFSQPKAPALILICSLHEWMNEALSEGNKFPKISTLFSYKGNCKGIVEMQNTISETPSHNESLPYFVWNICIVTCNI